MIPQFNHGQSEDLGNDPPAVQLQDIQKDTGEKL
jgi:hypothetical protein